MGSLELSCSNNRIVGKSLLGVTTLMNLPETHWAEIRSELAEEAVLISYNNEECEITYKIVDFRADELFGEISSRNCKVLKKDVSYNRDVLLLREI
jgi:hypothetical protein